MFHRFTTEGEGLLSSRQLELLRWRGSRHVVIDKGIFTSANRSGSHRDRGLDTGRNIPGQGVCCHHSIHFATLLLKIAIYCYLLLFSAWRLLPKVHHLFSSKRNYTSFLTQKAEQHTTVKMGELQTPQDPLPSPPFHHIEGINNFRDVGGYAISPTSSVRCGFLFRSAHLCSPTTEGAKALVEKLGIKAIYDFRSDPESINAPSYDFPGTTRKHVPVFRDQDASPDRLALRYSHYSSAEEGAAGFLRAYREILRSAPETGSFRTVFEHIRDRPDEPLLFHCTAGKDRTGVFAALALSIAGVDDYEVIGREYELTERGLGELRNQFIARLTQHPALNGDRDSAVRMTSAKAAAIKATLVWLDENHGGAEGYLKAELGFNDEDIRTIRKNLVVEEKAIL